MLKPNLTLFLYIFGKKLEKFKNYIFSIILAILIILLFSSFLFNFVSKHLENHKKIKNSKIKKFFLKYKKIARI
jgi:hypothetical protein